MKKKKAIIISIIILVLAACAMGSFFVYKKYFEKNPLEGIDRDFDGLIDKVDPKVNDNNFSAKLVTVKEKKRESDIKYSIDYRLFVDADNTKYNKKISKLCVVLSADPYSDTWFQQIDGVKAKTDEKYMKKRLSFLTVHGLKDVQYDSIDIHKDKEDADDVVDYMLGHYKFFYKGEVYDTLLMSVRGTQGDNSEWSSNFDVGSDTKEYYERTGQHSEWLHKDNHKGFDVASVRVKKRIDSYIATNLDKDSKKIVVITGHSRGAAIANILGSQYEKDESLKTFTYTFAAPNTTTLSTASNTTTVFNIINTNDLVPTMPMEGWGFTRYGKTVEIDASKYQDDFKKIVGKEYEYDDTMSVTRKKLTDIAKNRVELYKTDETDEGWAYFNMGDRVAPYSEDRVESVTDTMKREKLSPYAKCFRTDGLTYDRVAIRYCPAYFLQMIANMASDDNPCKCDGAVVGHGISGKYNDAVNSFIAASGAFRVFGIGGIKDPHRIETYIMLVDKI